MLKQYSSENLWLTGAPFSCYQFIKKVQQVRQAFTTVNKIAPVKSQTVPI